MVIMFKTEKLPISQTTVDFAREPGQSGYCVWCNAHMHSQRTGKGQWLMYCYDGQKHNNPICENLYKDHKTVLEWRNENWQLIFGSMDHEDPVSDPKEPPPTIEVEIDVNSDPDDDPDDDSEDDNDNNEDIDLTTDPGSTDIQHEEKEPPVIIHRPPHTMREVINCGVLFLVNLGAMISGGVRIGDCITSWIDRRWMFIAIFASLLHINPGFLSVPNPLSYHAFQFIPTNITRGVVEGTMWFRLQNQKLYINLRILIDPSLSVQAKKRLGDYFVKSLLPNSMSTNPIPKNKYDHFIAKELLVTSGKWRMTDTPAFYGKYARVTFETTIKSKHQLACCKSAMKWLHAQGEHFNEQK